MLRTWWLFFLRKHPCKETARLFPTAVSRWGLYLAGGAARRGAAHLCDLVLFSLHTL